MALKRSFAHIAVTMRRVGRRKWWQSLLHSGNDSLAIEGCHHLITDLIILFNVCVDQLSLHLVWFPDTVLYPAPQLHELVDISRWNRGQELQRKAEHAEILKTNKEIRGENHALAQQLAVQRSALSNLVWRADVSF